MSHDNQGSESTCKSCVDLSRVKRESTLMLVSQLLAVIVLFASSKEVFSETALKFLYGTGIVMSLFVLLQYFLLNVLGTRLFLYLDEEENLHIHKVHWWLKDVPYPEGVVLEIWIGGWFRKSKLHFSNYNPEIRLHYRRLSSLPSSISIVGALGTTLSVPFANNTVKEICATEMTDLLKFLSSHGIDEVPYLLANRVLSSSVAGKVGT